jgi:hypothetical protein
MSPQIATLMANVLPATSPAQNPAAFKGEPAPLSGFTRPSYVRARNLGAAGLKTGLRPMGPMREKKSLALV